MSEIQVSLKDVAETLQYIAQCLTELQKIVAKLEKERGPTVGYTPKVRPWGGWMCLDGGDARDLSRRSRRRR